LDRVRYIGFQHLVRRTVISGFEGTSSDESE